MRYNPPQKSNLVAGQYDLLNSNFGKGILGTYALVIAYDGTRYGGWQIQPNAVSIQSLIEGALSVACRERISVTGSSRTDAGVHALGQVAHFKTEGEIDPYRLRASLNGLLPEDIRILDVRPVEDRFHARYDAKRKIYRYHLRLERVLDPFTRLYSWQVPRPVNLELLKDAIPLFIGTKDFTAFANEAAQGAAAGNGVRTLEAVDPVEEKGGLRLEFRGTGFLYKMVRNITGTLIDVARGKIPKERIPEIFASKDRKAAGTAAPARGLFLFKIDYERNAVNEEK